MEDQSEDLGLALLSQSCKILQSENGFLKDDRLALLDKIAKLEKRIALLEETQARG